jgi:hypothetical protein
VRGEREGEGEGERERDSLDRVRNKELANLVKVCEENRATFSSKEIEPNISTIKIEILRY